MPRKPRGQYLTSLFSELVRTAENDLNAFDSLTRVVIREFNYDWKYCSKRKLQKYRKALLTVFTILEHHEDPDVELIPYVLGKTAALMDLVDSALILRFPKPVTMTYAFTWEGGTVTRESKR